jgi:hypothetical protein
MEVESWLDFTSEFQSLQALRPPDQARESHPPGVDLSTAERVRESAFTPNYPAFRTPF